MTKEVWTQATLRMSSQECEVHLRRVHDPYLLARSCPTCGLRLLTLYRDMAAWCLNCDHCESPTRTDLRSATT